MLLVPTGTVSASYAPRYPAATASGRAYRLLGREMSRAPGDRLFARQSSIAARPVLLAALLLISCAPTANRVPPPKGAPTDSPRTVSSPPVAPIAQAYLDAALDYMEENSLYRDRI